MKITDKILDIQRQIMKHPDGSGKDIADELGALATEAILGGIGSRHWKMYMKRHASNKQQLARLCGEDDVFNGVEWSDGCLAYAVLNSVCTIDTRRGMGTTPNEGTMNNMSSDMKYDLDDNLPTETGPLD